MPTLEVVNYDSADLRDGPLYNRVFYLRAELRDSEILDNRIDLRDRSLYRRSEVRVVIYIRESSSHIVRSQ